MKRQPRTPIWPFALFVLSGFAGLVLEAVLLRQLALLLGNSASATALVLAAFMGGLALGAVFFGPRADRTVRPVRLFGWLELGAAVSGAALVWLLGHGRETLLVPLRALGGGEAARIAEFVVAFGLVLVPTALMGGTLPALARAVIGRESRFITALGALYGLNTLGAAAGVFVAGFFLFERVGISAAAWLAATAQAAVGLIAIALGGAPIEEGSGTSGEGPVPPAPDGPAWASLLAAGAGGFVVLGFEVAWTRLLSLPMRSFSYSFSLMLSLFLVGLCGGAVLLALAGPRIRRPVRLLGWLLVAIGCWVASSFVWLPSLLAPAGASSFDEFLVRAVLRAAPIVLPPTILSGVALPLAARIFWGGAGRTGRDVGRVYAVNTGGAIAGSLVAGLVLLPALGAPAALALLAAASATAGAVVLSSRPGGRAATVVAAVLAVACAVPAFLGNGRFVDAFLRATRTTESIGELLYFHEGAADTVAVVRRTYGFHDPEAKSLITNGVAMSATVKPVWRYMAVEGHLPVLLAAAPRRVLAVGVGTGITLGAVVAHPAIAEITAIELSEGVIGALPYFEKENGRAWEDSRVRLVRADGRHWLELSSERFDAITLEPPPPIVAGSVHLYSREFYELCLRRLEPGGVVAQWLPLHAQSLESARMTARTFLDAFPHAMLWLPSVRDAVLVGSADPFELPYSRLVAAWSEPRTRANLEAAYLETPEALLATFLLDRAGLEAWVGDALPITDERPRMEFFRHQRAGNMADPDLATLLEPPQGARDWLRGAPQDAAFARGLELESRAVRLHVRAAVDDDPNSRVTAARIGLATEYFLYPLGCTLAQLDALRADRTRPPGAVAAQEARCAGLRAARDATRGR